MADNELSESIREKIIKCMSIGELRHYRRFAWFYFPKNKTLIRRLMSEEIERRARND